MYVSVRKYEMDPGSVDELMQKVNDEFLPIISGTPGFIAYYVLDAGDGVVASVNVFEDQAGVEESNRRAADWVKTVASLLPNPPQTTAGEVRAHKAKQFA